MSPETLFAICSWLAVFGWLLLVFAPGWKWSARVIAGVVIPLLLGLLYLYLIITHFRESGGGFGSLAEVSQLFRNPYNLLAGWIHYLAFDLFIGSWEVRDARRLGIHHLLVVPCLLLTFMLGPIGLLLYFLLRSVLKRRFIFDEESA
ncbi:MAG TPA: ABA4-like family protein [Pyrinomonadaceae bacterium]|nr:ABA4-like family protein [Pyrinomonadaceae bacterium]